MAPAARRRAAPGRAPVALPPRLPIPKSAEETVPCPRRTASCSPRASRSRCARAAWRTQPLVRCAGSADALGLRLSDLGTALGLGAQRARAAAGHARGRGRGRALPLAAAGRRAGRGRPAARAEPRLAAAATAAARRRRMANASAGLSTSSVSDVGLAEARGLQRRHERVEQERVRPVAAPPGSPTWYQPASCETRTRSRRSRRLRSTTASTCVSRLLRRDAVELHPRALLRGPASGSRGPSRSARAPRRRPRGRRPPLPEDAQDLERGRPSPVWTASVRPVSGGRGPPPRPACGRWRRAARRRRRPSRSPGRMPVPSMPFAVLRRPARRRAAGATPRTRASAPRCRSPRRSSRCS